MTTAEATTATGEIWRVWPGQIKMTPEEQEQEDAKRVERAKNAVKYYRKKEAEAIKELAGIRASLAVVTAKYEAAFSECEARAVERRRAGLIENRID